MSKLELETLVSLAKRRGFVFPASEIYGGISGFYDYGPYGAQLMHNLASLWWKDFVQVQPNVVGLDSAIIQHPKLWQSSGHVDTFSDPLVECKHCHQRFRADQIKDDKCPNCGQTGTFTQVKDFKLMFQTQIGPVAGANSTAYLRPETAGGIFTNFQVVREVTRSKLPFGIAQIGKAFRNEISPRDFLFRLREFKQAELEYFIAPTGWEGEFDRWFKYCKDWLVKIGLDKTKLQDHEHNAKERAHYSKKTVDILYEYPFGKDELWGVAYRTDYDLAAHQKGSGKDLTYFDPATGKKFLPHVIEPSLGLDRLFLAVLDSAYHEEEVKGESRAVLKLHPDLAPVKVAVLPLSKDAKLSPLAQKVFDGLKDQFAVEYDETQSIGKRYRRQDEIGTPYCVTIDFDSLTDKAVTIRDRDTMKQTRIKITELEKVLGEG